MEQVFNVLRHREIEGIDKYDVYVENDGYEGLKAALGKSPDEVTDLVKQSGLRGRGGAGFPTGVKWGFVPKDTFPKYLVCNFAEGEPGTFKDREIVENNPHQLIEGIIICCYAIKAETAYIYHRGEFTYPAMKLREAIDAARDAGWLEQPIGDDDFSVTIHLHQEASAYICGEETAQLNSLEGYMGQPRLKPPFPAVEGLWGQPTVINNVETLTNLPRILINGPEWYRQYGTEKNPGTRIYCVSGQVKRPGNYELPCNVTAREIIFEHAGGVWKGRGFKAFIPGGVSAPMLSDEYLDIEMTFDALSDAGSMGGSGGVIVIDDETDIAWVTSKAVHFFREESCGKCSPCREGTFWQDRISQRLLAGEGNKGDVEMLKVVSDQMENKCFCPLGEASRMVVQGAYRHFRTEFDAHGNAKSGTRPRHGQEFAAREALSAQS